MSHLSSLDEAFQTLKNSLEKHNLTLQEISINTGVSEAMLSIFFDNSNNVVNDLSRLFTFMKFSIKHRENKLKIFDIQRMSTHQYRVKRLIEPKCEIYYDLTMGKYIKFNFKHKRNKLNEKIYKQLLINELAEKLNDYLKL